MRTMSTVGTNLSTVGTNYQHVVEVYGDCLSRLSTVSNVDWAIIVRVAAFKATASIARHHQSQSQLLKNKALCSYYGVYWRPILEVLHGL